MADRFPTADQVATAIVAACRETGGPLLTTALALARGERDPRVGTIPYPISRARIYAALALDDIFECGGTAIARMVGVGANASKGTLLPTARSNIANNALRWFDPVVLERVKAAVRACPAGPAPPQPPGGNAKPAGPPQRPIPVSAAVRTAASAFSCEQCGKPKSVGSAKLCRNCYRGLTPRNRTAAPDDTVAARARQAERAIEAPDRFAGLGPQDYVSGSSGKRALQEMLANAAAETARQQARQRGE